MNPPISPDDKFIMRLKANQERITSPRLTLFRLLRQNSPLPMSSLSSKAKNSGIDTVTVYRTVALFKQLKLVQEIGLGRKRMLELTDDFGGHHHHLWCTRCGRMLDFDDVAIEKGIEVAAKHMGIKVESHQLEVVGICSDCRKLEHQS